MIDLLLVALGLVAVLVTLSFFLNWYAHFWYKTLVADQMELINAIVLTEEVPKAWRVPVLDPAARRDAVLAESARPVVFGVRAPVRPVDPLVANQFIPKQRRKSRIH